MRVIGLSLILSAACKSRGEPADGAIEHFSAAVAADGDAAPSDATVQDGAEREGDLQHDSSTQPLSRIAVCIGTTEDIENADSQPGAPLAFYLVAEFASRNPWAGQDFRESNGRAVLYEELSADLAYQTSSRTFLSFARRIRVGDPADASDDETYLDLEEALGPWARDLRRLLLAATSELVENSGRRVLTFDEIRRRNYANDSAVFDVRISIDQGTVGNNIHGQGATMQLSGSVTTRGELLVRARLVRTLVLGPEEAHFSGQPYRAARRVVRKADVVSVSRRCTP